MPKNIEDILASLDQLSRRLDRVEHALGLHPAPDEREAPSPSDAGTSPSEPKPSEPVEPAPARAEATPLLRRRLEPDAPAARPGPAPSPTAGTPAGLERLVGLRAFGVVGALVVVIGAALFLKLAWDQGWLRVSDAARCWAAAGFGGVLLAAGEAARRRWSGPASAGLSAAGLGVLYAAAYAAFAYFNLVPRSVSFVLLLGVGALGVAVSARARLASVGLVSIVGGYLAPILLAGGQDPPAYFLPAYWLCLLTVGLSLAVVLGRGFVLLRALVWWGSVVFGGVWVLAYRAEHAEIALPFIVLVWSGVHVELVLSAARSRLAAGAVPLGNARRTTAGAVRALTSSLSLTAWLVGLGVGVVRSTTLAHLDWTVPAGAFAATALGALALAGGLRVVRDPPTNDLERLGAVLGVQAGALLVVLGIIVLPTWTHVLAGAALGVGASVGGRWLRARGMEIYALVVLALAAGRVVLFDWWTTNAASIGVERLGLFWSRWMLLTAAVGAAWLVAGGVALLGVRSRARRLATVEVSVGLALIYASCLHESADAASIVYAWLGLSMAVGGLRPAAPGLHLDRAALVGVAAAAAAWCAAFPGSWSTAPGWLHPGLVSALAITASGWTLSWLGRAARDGSPGGRAWTRAGVVGGVLLLLVATSLEAARLAERLASDETARRAALSIWWGVFAAPLLAIGFGRRLPAARYAALALIGAATAKALVWDLAGVAPAWRVASLLGLGLLMLIVALVYARTLSATAGPARGRAVSSGDDDDPERRPGADARVD